MFGNDYSGSLISILYISPVEGQERTNGTKGLLSQGGIKNREPRDSVNVRTRIRMGKYET